MATQLQQIASSAVRQSVNNGRRAPLQGFDTVVYFQDQQTGTMIPFGEFTGFQYTIRNATEPYLPLGHRNLSLLDGEFQIGFVAEQGKINLEATPLALGYNFVGPILRFGRSPRFQIVIEYNAPELDESNGIPGYGQYDIISDVVTTGFGGTGTNNSADAARRITTGRYIFSAAKIDAFTSGAMAGRSVIADRLEGLAEGFSFESLTQDEAIFNRATLFRDTQNGTDLEINNYLQRISDPGVNFGNQAPSWATAG